jgi:aconitate hydratase
VVSIHAASERARIAGVPLVVLAGAEYGSGSSRDWAAKGTAMLGRPRRHRALVRADPPVEPDRHGSAAAGVPDGQDAASLGLTGDEVIDIAGVAGHRGRGPRHRPVSATRVDGTRSSSTPRVRIDTPGEAEYFRHGGILPYVLRQLRDA